MATRRRLGFVLILVSLLAGMAGGASAATCPDPENTDCPALPSSSEFTQLADDTLAYFPTNPIRRQLVQRVELAQEALYPPNPAHPPSPIRSFAMLGAYQHQVEGLAGTPNGATDAGTTLLLNEAFDLQSKIVAAFPTVQFPPRRFHPPNPA